MTCDLCHTPLMLDRNTWQLVCPTCGTTYFTIFPEVRNEVEAQAMRVAGLMRINTA